MANFIEWIATAVGSILALGGFGLSVTPNEDNRGGCIACVVGIVMVVLGVGFYVHWNMHWLLG